MPAAREKVGGGGGVQTASLEVRGEDRLGKCHPVQSTGISTGGAGGNAAQRGNHSRDNTSDRDDDDGDGVDGGGWKETPWLTILIS